MPATFVLVNPMVPTAGESASQWWCATGQARAMDTSFDQPWPLDAWPDVTTGVVAGSELADWLIATLGTLPTGI